MAVDIGNVAEVLPEGMGTLAGTVTPAPFRLTTMPEAGATAVIVTVPSAESPPITVDGAVKVVKNG